MKEDMQESSVRRQGMRYLFGMLLVVTLASGAAIYLSGSHSSETNTGATYQTARSFSGGKFEASGVAYVRDTDGILFVDDGKTGEVLWMQIDKEGNQTGPVKAIRLGVNIEDPEGITTDGEHFYLVSSQSKSKDGGRFGIVRFKFNPASQSAEAVETVSDLKRLLIENVTELRDIGARRAKDDGINIEGLAWDPAGQRLLLGLRSPVIDGQALLVPLKLRDARGPFSSENLETKEMTVIRLPLGGHGIRSIEHDERSGVFHIIAGATESQEKTDFELWEWSGGSDPSALREVATFDRKLKPEGVTRATIGDSQVTIVVFDTSKYLKLQP